MIPALSLSTEVPDIVEQRQDTAVVSRSGMSNSLGPHGLQHDRLSCPPLSPGVYPKSCPNLYDPMNHSMPGLPVHHQLLEFTQTHAHRVSDAISSPSHPAISSSVIPFSSCPQSLPASGSFPMSQLFASGGQSTGVSASASVLPMNTQD